MSSRSQTGNQLSEYIGIVVEDKARDSKEIKVYVKELLPFYSGKIEAKEQVGNANGRSVKNTNYVKAIYFSDDTNRYMPPDVKKGEQVKVFCYADADTFYWKSIGRDDKLRRHEQINTLVANSDEPQDVNDDNAFGLTMDTHEDKKIVKLFTSKSSGEKFKYTITLDAKANFIHICDDDDNEIRIDSEIPRILMKNKKGALVDIAEENVIVCAPQDLTLKAGRQTLIDTPIITMDHGGVGTSVMNMNNMTLNGKSVVINSPCIGLQGAVETSSIVSGTVVATGYSTHSGSMGRSRMMMANTYSNSNTPTVQDSGNSSGMTSLGNSNGGSSNMSSTTELAQNIAGTIPSGGRSDRTSPPKANANGGYGTYSGVATMIASGTSTSVSNSPNTSGSGGNNRHCAAYEEVSSAVEAICSELKKIDAYLQSKHGSGYGEATSSIISTIHQSIMYKNRGE